MWFDDETESFNVEFTWNNILVNEMSIPVHNYKI